MAGSDVEVAAQGGDVHGEMRHGLGPVADDDRPDLVGTGGDLSDRVDRPEHVGDMADRDDADVLGEHPVEGVEVEGGAILHRDRPQGRPGVPAGELPGDEVGVVLHLGRDHLVALAQAVPRPGVGEEVQGLRSRLGEHDPPGRRSADQLGDLRPGALVEHRGALPQGMHRPVDVGVVLLEEPDHLLDHLARLLGGGCVVQVAEEPAVDVLVEYGKVLPDLSGIHGLIVLRTPP